MITIQFNGDIVELAEATNVADLCKLYDIPGEGIAVVIDEIVVPRGAHETTLLKQNARVDIIRAVAGG